MIDTLEVDGVIAFVAGPLEPDPVLSGRRAVGSVGLGWHGVVTLVGGKFLGVSGVIVVWPQGTEVGQTSGRLTLTHMDQAVAVGDEITAGRELASLVSVDQEEVNRRVPPECADADVVVMSSFARFELDRGRGQ